MNKAEAYSPASISFIFRKVEGINLLSTGSLGIGCTLNKGVTAIVEKAKKTKVLLNDKAVKLPTVEYACRKLIDQPIKINLYSSLPLGCGFGLSAASTLASLLAVNYLFGLGKNKLKVAEIAHISEIINHTGLGSVGTQMIGGFLLKKTPGIPFQFTRLRYAGKNIYATVMGKLETPTVLGNVKHTEMINQIADQVLNRINKDKSLTLEKIFDYSLDFVEKSGLLKNKDVISLIKIIKETGGHATMSILGNVVLSTIPLRYKAYPVYKLSISNDNLATCKNG